MSTLFIIWKRGKMTKSFCTHFCLPEKPTQDTQKELPKHQLILSETSSKEVIFLP